MSRRAFIEHLAHGQRLRREGKLTEAIEELRAAVRLHPDHAGALFELGRLYFMQRRNDEAEHCLSLAVEQAPKYLKAHKLLGIACSQLQHWPQAEEHLKQAIKLSNGKDAEAWATLAMVYLSRGKLNQAYRRCQKALALDATSTLAYVVKAFALIQERDVEAAEAAIHEAASHGPELGYLHYVLGEIYAHIGDVEAARSEYLAAVKLPDIPPVIVYEALLALSDDPHEQTFYLEQIVANRPTAIASRKKLIRLYLTARRFEDALSELQTLGSVLEADEDGKVLLLWGDYYTLHRQFESALEAYRRAMSLIPDSPDPLYRLGEVLTLLENNQQAIDYFRKAIKLRRRAGADYFYEPLFASDKVEENRDIARGDGIGPFDLLWWIIYIPTCNAWKSLQGWASSPRELLYPLIALTVSVLFELWTSRSAEVFFEELSGAIIRIAAMTLWGTFMLKGAHRLIKTTIIFRSKVWQWSLVITLFSLPLALLFMLLNRSVCIIPLIFSYGISVLLTALLLHWLPVMPTRRNIIRESVIDPTNSTSEFAHPYIWVNLAANY